MTYINQHSAGICLIGMVRLSSPDTIGVVFDDRHRKIEDLTVTLQQRLQVSDLYDQIYILYDYLQVHNIKVFLILTFAEVIKLRMLVVYTKTCGRDVHKG